MMEEDLLEEIACFKYRQGRLIEKKKNPKPENNTLKEAIIDGDTNPLTDEIC